MPRGRPRLDASQSEPDGLPSSPQKKKRKASRSQSIPATPSTPVISDFGPGGPYSHPGDMLMHHSKAGDMMMPGGAGGPYHDQMHPGMGMPHHPGMPPGQPMMPPPQSMSHRMPALPQHVPTGGMPSNGGLHPGPGGGMPHAGGPGMPPGGGPGMPPGGGPGMPPGGGPGMPPGGGPGMPPGGGNFLPGARYMRPHYPMNHPDMSPQPGSVPPHSMPPGSYASSQPTAYPSNTPPMIFNSSNPNAPPIHTCGLCHKMVHDSDQAILCESGCNFWFHRQCTGLSEVAHQLLRKEVFAEWVCDSCLSSKNIPLIKVKP